MDNVTEEPKKVKEGFVGQQMIVLPPDIKKTVTKNPLIKGLYLTAIGYYPRASYHDRERRSGSPQHILLYCLDGKGFIQIGKKKYDLKPNTYFIIPKGIPHHYGTSISEPWSIYWAHFCGENSDLLLSRYTRDSTPEVQMVPFDEQRIGLFKLIFSMLENNYSTRNIELVNIKMQELLCSFIYHEELYPSYYSTDNISSSIKFMKENLVNSYSIKELASHLNYSVSHYSELFKKKTGCSPIQYFNQLKIQKSCQLLFFTDLNIKEICVKTGFEDPYYFSRIFKKLMGISPSKYRHMYKK